MPMVELPKHPARKGQSLEGYVTYDLPADVTLPYPRNPLAAIVFTGKFPNEVIADMDARKTRFEADQAVNLKNPGVWENVGYVDEGLTITAYYQIGFPQKGQFEQESMEPYQFQPVTVTEAGYAVQPPTANPDAYKRPNNPTTPFFGRRDWE